MKTLNALARDLYAAKNDEATAKAKRIEIEVEIADQVVTPENGSKTVDAGEGLKVSVKRALAYEGDVEALHRELGEDAPVELIPEEWAFSARKYEKLRAESPALFAHASQFVTTKPRKVAVLLKLA